MSARILKFRDDEIRDPLTFFKGWSKRDFIEWLKLYGVDSSKQEHIKSVNATIKELEQCEMHEFCAMAKIYLDSISCASV